MAFLIFRSIFDVCLRKSLHHHGQQWTDRFCNILLLFIVRMIFPPYLLFLHFFCFLKGHFYFYFMRFLPHLGQQRTDIFYNTLFPFIVKKIYFTFVSLLYCFVCFFFFFLTFLLLLLKKSFWLLLNEVFIPSWSAMNWQIF